MPENTSIVMTTTKHRGATVAALFLSLCSLSANANESVLNSVERRSNQLTDLSDLIWDLAEVGYQETRSSAALKSALEAEGFAIESGVAEIPTAFIASYGSGEPVIAVMGEFDALPGISQAALPYPKAIEGKHSAQACGHHLFGTGSLGAAIATKEWLEQTGTSGTIQFFGTPAEEGGSGKVYMVRAGLFDNVDTVIHWHPASVNAADSASTLANRSAKFTFSGISSHAASAPERGRSALDAVESMNFMVNLLREHVPASTRLHYVITDGGSAPNVVPNKAQSFYYVRHPDESSLRAIWDRVVATAEAAALGTSTTMSYEVIHGNYSVLPNDTLAQVMHKNLSAVGGVNYTEADVAFANEIAKTLPDDALLAERAAQIKPYTSGVRGNGSTDVGDVSWTVPTVGMSAATWVPGTGAHTWQAVAAGRTPIGHKGMIVAAKSMALTAVDLFKNPALLSAAKDEFYSRRGRDFEYEALLGDREPPLDYRR
jgi:aminobenzoyl-glutamate utilization protein B